MEQAIFERAVENSLLKNTKELAEDIVILYMLNSQKDWESLIKIATVERRWNLNEIGR